VLINVNITDITDESGYIEAIGRKAASEAIQQAEIDVAMQVKRGAIGVAEADRDKMIQVANNEKTRDMGTKEAERERAVRLAELEKERKIGEQTAAYEQEARVRTAEQTMRISVAEANARAVAGENKSKAEMASTNAELKVREAEAYQLGETRSREAQAKVLEAQYLAQARAAEARGNYEILAKKGEGLKRIIDSCGGSQAAFQMMMLEHIDELSKTAAMAISNIKFDKVVVWDSGAAKDGSSATSNFVKGVASSLPPMMHMMSEIGGVKMPEYFGKLVDESVARAASPAIPPTPPESGPASKKH